MAKRKLAKGESAEALRGGGKKTKKKIEKPALPWQKKREEFWQPKIKEKIIKKQEKLIKGWRRT